jgi:hypothetical protein
MGVWVCRAADAARRDSFNRLRQKRETDQQASSQAGAAQETRGQGPHYHRKVAMRQSSKLEHARGGTLFSTLPFLEYLATKRRFIQLGSEIDLSSNR